MSTFKLQIVTPTCCYFDGEGEKIVTRTICGDICILPKHIDYLTALSSGETRVTIDGKMRRAACSGGMLSVNNNVVRLVANTFEWAEEIDTQRAEKAKEKAEKMLQESKDNAELEVAKAKLSRAMTRIKVSTK